MTCVNQFHVENQTMPMNVQCSECGTTFRSPDKAAIRWVKCPKCRQVLKMSSFFMASNAREASGILSSGTSDVLLVSLTCTCGKKLRANVEHAGRRSKCLACGRTVRIPHPAAIVLGTPTPNDSLLHAVMQELATPETLPGGSSLAESSMSRLRQRRTVTHHRMNLRTSAQSADDYLNDCSLARISARRGLIWSADYAGRVVEEEE